MKKIASIALCFLLILLLCVPALAEETDIPPTDAVDIIHYSDDSITYAMGITITANVNVRAGAGTNFKVLGKLKKGTDTYAVALEGDWLKISWKESEGYVLSKYTKLYTFGYESSQTLEEAMAEVERGRQKTAYMEKFEKFFGKYPDQTFPSYYGGRYFDGWPDPVAKFHILTTDMSESVQKTLRDNLGEDIFIEQAKYSLKELQKKEKSLEALLRTHKDISIRVNEMENAVVITVYPSYTSKAAMDAVKKAAADDRVKIDYMDNDPPKA